MSYYLFLDDVRNPADVKWVQMPNDSSWVIARSYGEFVDIIEQRGLPSFVAFDHDLAEFHYKAGFLENEGKLVDYGPEKTGFEAARWLCDYCIVRDLQFPNYVVHSMNVVGAKRIDDYIQFCKKRAGI